MSRLRAAWTRRLLHFRFTARTSRETMTVRPTWFVKLWHDDTPEIYGIGECAHFAGLSAEPTERFESRLADYCSAINRGLPGGDLSGWSSIAMGVETAMADLNQGGVHSPFPGSFSRGDTSVTINGLVWMGSADEMLRRIDGKLSQGFRCLKMKIGGVEFDRELELLRHIRQSFSSSDLTLRVDANGAFTPADAMSKLERLAEFEIHSIEQPIRAGQWQEMQKLCEASPIAIALDEELIGISAASERRRLINAIKPQYLILKPTLCGGFSGAQQWIDEAEAAGISWWVTSALESNIGLNAIAQWTAKHNVTIPQGLGTGQLFTDNIPSPLYLSGDNLCYNPSDKWILSQLKWLKPC